MSITKKGKVLYLTFRPFGKLIYVKTDVGTKGEARLIEMAIMTACRSGDYRALTAAARAVCVRMFENQGWELPEGLGGERPREELTLWRAVELFVQYPGVRDHPSRWRHEIALAHLVDELGKDTPIRSIWVPRLREYQVTRQNEGAAPSTINRELSTLSRLFTVLIEMQLMESNPCRLVKRLSTKSSERQIYMSAETVQAVADRCPPWYQSVVWTAFYSGMRRGEILGLTRKQVSLSRRMIFLGSDNTKEGHKKRIPIHKELVPILQAVLQGPSLLSGRIFPLQDGKGVRDLELETFKNCWPRACEALDLEQPWPRFHDLRATWKTNARRSGVHPEIEMAIMGHSERGRSVHERYGRISDRELVDAIDLMTFNHGESEIVVAR